MSGFDAEWLGLRAAADLRARNAGLAARVAAHFAIKETLSILDLGCGTGANLRASYALYPKIQHWQLVDHDVALLEVGKQTLMHWADEGRTEADGGLHLKKDGYKLHIEFLQRDLSRDLDGLFENDPHLVTASALFDLVSDAWLARFVDMIAERGSAVYALLTYDGDEKWLPSLPLDEAVHAGFLAHQHRDKGFGAALGPEAPDALRSHLEAFRFKVDVAGSPWCLTQERDGDLMVALADGIASASCESGTITEEQASDWLASRSKAHFAHIGHQDLFAAPPD
jgi:SAM-dependent methyltransferase